MLPALESPATRTTLVFKVAHWALGCRLTNQANRPRADDAPAPPASGPVERWLGPADSTCAIATKPQGRRGRVRTSGTDLHRGDVRWGRGQTCPPLAPRPPHRIGAPRHHLPQIPPTGQPADQVAYRGHI